MFLLAIEAFIDGLLQQIPSKAVLNGCKQFSFLPAPGGCGSGAYKLAALLFLNFPLQTLLTQHIITNFHTLINYSTPH